MKYVLMLLLYVIILFFDFRSICNMTDRTQRRLYLVLGIFSALSAIPAAYWTHLDHAGASLSGMLSQFIS